MSGYYFQFSINKIVYSLHSSLEKIVMIIRNNHKMALQSNLSMLFVICILILHSTSSIIIIYTLVAVMFGYGDDDDDDNELLALDRHHRRIISLEKKLKSDRILWVMMTMMMAMIFDCIWYLMDG